jgi:heat shock protein HtpX
MLFGSGHRDNENGGGNPILAIAVMIFAPIAAMLIQFAISRTREFGADAGGAGISGDPHALASALDKIDRYARGLPMEVAEANPATAQMMIINPLSGGGLSGLFSTHPPTEERIARLHAMA